jgi:threonyl-tRNA synthetase
MKKIASETPKAAAFLVEIFAIRPMGCAGFMNVSSLRLMHKNSLASRYEKVSASGRLKQATRVRPKISAPWY